MKALLLLVMIVLGSAVAGLAQNFAPWGDVKSWTGTLAIELVTTDENASGQRVSTTYAATGALTLVDEMMPAGGHQQWPVPGMAEMTDPARVADAQKKWPAHIVVTHTVKGVDELGQRVDIRCAADITRPVQVHLVAIPWPAPTYQISIEPPNVDSMTCTGTDTRPQSYGVPKRVIELRQPLGAAAPIGGTSTFVEGPTRITVTYALSPVK